MLKEEDVAKLKTLKDYVLMKGELHCRMPKRILSRCVGHKEAQRKLEEVRSRTCGFYNEVSLYYRLQRTGFYWSSMSKDVDLVQTQNKAYHLAVDREESYAVFTTEDWRSPFIGYLTKGVLPKKHGKRYKIKKLVTYYFLHKGILSKKGYNGDPLRFLGPEEANAMLKEVHLEECGEHQERKKLYWYILQMGYYWPTIRKDEAEFVKKCHGYQVQANLIHNHPQSLQSVVTP